MAIADVDRLITDPDSTTLVSATVQITAGLLPADSLAFTNVPATMGNITAGAYSSGTGLITLTSAGGTATLAQWQAALSAVNFATTSNTAGSRTVTVIVNDGALSSTAATTTISVVNSGNPTVAAASATGLEDAVAGIPITLAASDPDGTISSFTLSSLPTGGTLYTDAAMTQVAAISTAYAASANSLTLYGNYLMWKGAHAREYQTYGAVLVVFGLGAVAGLLLVDAQLHKVDWGYFGTWFWIGSSVISGGWGLWLMSPALRGKALSVTG